MTLNPLNVLSEWDALRLAQAGHTLKRDTGPIMVLAH